MAFKPAAGAAIPLGTIAVSKLGFAHGLPVSGELAYSGLHMTSEQIPHPQVAATLKQLGLDAATLSLGF